MKNYLIIIILFLTTSCAETVLIGTGATVLLIKQEKSVNDTKKDIIIATKIDKDFLVNGLKNPNNKIGTTINKQRVLLTGLIDDEKIIKKANKIASKVDGVKEVIDEIQFNDDKKTLSSLKMFLSDSTITNQIYYKSLLDNQISLINFEAITVNKIVYLIGVAKNKKEIDKINDIAAATLGVKKVISHIILKD